MKRKMKKIAARWPETLSPPRNDACIAASRESVITMPLRPVSMKVRRPILSIKKAVNMLPGKEAVTQRAERRSGMYVFIPRLV